MPLRLEGVGDVAGGPPIWPPRVTTSILATPSDQELLGRALAALLEDIDGGVELAPLPLVLRPPVYP